jgi:DNA-binding GntR family transcriptional regulator
MSEDAIRRALGEGNRTFRIAARVDMPTAQVRSVLRRLERDGIVYRDQYLSAMNDTFWRPRGAPMTDGAPA